MLWKKIAACSLAACLLLSCGALSASAASAGYNFDYDLLLTTPGGTSTGWVYEKGYYSGYANSITQYYSKSSSISEGPLMSGFMPMTGYTISITASATHNNSVNESSLIFRFFYDDGSFVSLPIITNLNERTYSFTSDPDKNLSCVYLSLNYNAYVSIKDISITRRYDNLESYDNVIPNDFVDVFRDIISDEPIFCSYVASCTAEGEYSLFIGDISFEEGYFLSDSNLKVITLKIDEFNSLVYDVSSASGLTLSSQGKIVYSNLGDFPNLIRRGEIYEILQTILIAIIGCTALVIRILSAGKRR